MGEIVDFTARRNKKNEASKKLPTLAEITVDAVDFLLGDWERMARGNRLNDYFKAALPSFIDQETRVNFMSDLNEVAKLELKLDLFPMVFFPGTIGKEQLGWVVQYRVGEELVCSPEMASECYARTFGILLYLKVKRDALGVGVWK